MDRLLENWLDETIAEMKVETDWSELSLRDFIFSAIAEYRAPAWVQSPRRV